MCTDKQEALRLKPQAVQEGCLLTQLYMMRGQLEDALEVAADLREAAPQVCRAASPYTHLQHCTVAGAVLCTLPSRPPLVNEQSSDQHYALQSSDQSMNPKLRLDRGQCLYALQDADAHGIFILLLVAEGPDVHSKDELASAYVSLLRCDPAAETALQGWLDVSEWRC